MTAWRTLRSVFSAALLLSAVSSAVSSYAADGRELIDASLRRHAQPAYVYEEQTLIVIDNLRQHTVRTARYYLRKDATGSRSLLLVDTPSELRGVNVFVARDMQGGRRGPSPSSALLGSDFSIADFEGEQPQDFTYRSEDSQDLDRISHHVILATPASAEVSRATGYGLRRLFIRKDNLFITRIDYLDREGQPAKRLTFRDPRPDESGGWRPGMILNEDLRESRRSLIKVERRVHSADYVPEAIFARLQ